MFVIIGCRGVGGKGIRGGLLIQAYRSSMVFLRVRLVLLVLVYLERLSETQDRTSIPATAVGLRTSWGPRR